MLARLRKAQQENDGGFTLIELLVVVIIIGILAAIAIPTFLSQREKAWEKAALSDLRNAAVVAEEWYSDPAGGNGSYLGFTYTKTSQGVSVALKSGDAAGYCLDATHASLPTETFMLDSATGKAVAGSACP